ncbi:MAG TPA: ATP-binding protein [Vicinamibacterales bacterium]|nr:ATP-binding protein [Vicinamibacterales bacterium]
MRRWFARLPIHQKLVVSALLVTGVALVMAMLGLSVIDALRYRVTAREDAVALARVIAENTSAAVAFGDADAASETLASVRVRDVVTRACIYLSDGRLFAAYAKGTLPCPESAPAGTTWDGVLGNAVISRNGRTQGAVFVERDLSDLRGRLLVTVIAGTLVLIFAASMAYMLAQRVHATTSGPISALAQFARGYGDDPTANPPALTTAPDEVGDLVRSFNEMLARVRRANDDATAANRELKRSNEALRHENEERRRVETEREAALAREREANRLKDEFLAAVSHELRTPLNAMMGWAQVLATAPPSEETIRKAVTSIVKNARMQTRVIEDLVDVSRIVTGKMRLTFQPLDVRSVVASAVESMERVADVAGVHIDQALPRDSCFVMGDRDRLQQVLWNLISNGVKFTPQGGTVSVTVSRQDGKLQVVVSDTGIGILPSFLPHVFDRFRQADGSLTREHGGLGLGLAIVKDLTELHGGSVAASSEGRNRGAIFSLTLPEMRAEPSEEQPVEEDTLPSLEGVKVFAVDDNDDAVAMIAASLARAGAQVNTFTNPVEAMTAWRQQPADVLVCDLAMPHMSGLDLLQNIRQFDSKRGVFTPAVAVSAHASEQHQAESLRGGFQFHLAKPLHQDVLVRAIAEAVHVEGRNRAQIG